MIVGFSINRMNAEKGKVKKGNVNVNYSQGIEDVKEASSPAVEEKLLKVNFTFTVSYKQDNEETGNIQFEGHVLWRGDAEKILETWKDEKKLPEEVLKPLTNNIYKRGITQSVIIADSMDMPSPVPLPRVED